MQRAQFVPSHYYHIYNRGVNRENIFFCRENWVLFLKKLHQYFDGTHAHIVAYCLMPTHYHLLVYAATEDISTRVMQPFATAYTKSVNTRQDRVGPIFQGPFQSRLVANDEYLRHLSRYIHRNPSDAGLVAEPCDWQFSSYRDYLGMRNGTLPHPDAVLNQFSSRDEYRSFVELLHAKPPANCTSDWNALNRSEVSKIGSLASHA